MTSKLPKPNARDLQEDVIDLLEQISSLMHRASDEVSKKYAEFQQEVDSETEKVKNLELRMAVVAPMKAGKSTIINAIIGQEVLPSRNAAMTTLPTEIIFNSEIAEPTLTLSAEILSVFQETFLALKQKIQTLGTELMQEKLGKQTHLVKSAQKIQVEACLPIRGKTFGFEEIEHTLIYLNDIIRLCSLLEPYKNPLCHLVDILYIETPFWRSPKNNQSQMLGHLVIVDTPGPNEAGENLGLADVVAEQLRKSSIVLIVLNFTALNTKADEEVKKEVQKVIQLRGKENLYVLVNKVDERRKGDMNTEDVRQFVASQFGIVDSNTDRVFEISAIRALSATKFLLELQQCPNVNVAEMKTAEALAREALGIRWEAKLQNISLEELQDEAEHLWKESGFAPFIDKAINALIESAAPRCMRSALNLSRSLLVQLSDEVKLRSSGITKEANELQQQVSALEADLEHLELCRNSLQKVDEIKARLQQKLNAILKELEEKAKVSLEEYFNQEEYERANLFDKANIGAKKLREFFRGKDYNSSGVVEFKAALDAEEFIDLALAHARQKVDFLLKSVREKTTAEVENSCKSLLTSLEKETKEIIERARTRLNEAFQVDLSPPPMPHWNYVDYDRAKSAPRTREKTEYQVRKYRPWWLLWLVELEEQVLINRKESYHTVFLEEVITNINQSIAANVNNINKGIESYLDEDFQQRINVFFENLDCYLRSYRDSLRQAQEDQKLSLDGKKKLADGLGLLVSESTELIKKVDTYIERIDDLMPDK